MIHLLLDHGHDPNEPDVFGQTPLHKLVGIVNTDSMKALLVLLEKGANPTLQDMSGKIPSDLAKQFNTLAYFGDKLPPPQETITLPNPDQINQPKPLEDIANIMVAMAGSNPKNVRLPKPLSVGKLREEISRFFNLPIDQFGLLYSDIEKDVISVEDDEDLEIFVMLKIAQLDVVLD